MSLETMTHALERLAADGYTASFSSERGGVLCSACDSWHVADDVQIEEIVRFEGESDPADEAVLFALACGQCGAKGTLVAAYGPDMDPDDVALVLKLDDRRDR